MRAKILAEGDQEIAAASEGELFGEFAFITGNPRSATIIADGKLTLYELKRPLLEEIISGNPEVMDYINDIYKKRVDEVIKRIHATKRELLEAMSEEGSRV